MKDWKAIADKGAKIREELSLLESQEVNIITVEQRAKEIIENDTFYEAVIFLAKQIDIIHYKRINHDK